MPEPTVVILAAGQGTRMRSRTPKVLHPICGRPMIGWPVAAAQAAGFDRIVVVGGPDKALAGHLPEHVQLAVQTEPRGTGDAVLAAADSLDRDTTVLVLSGDVPLITAEFLRDLADAHAANQAAATMATMELDDPSGYGRVVHDADGSVERVVETKTPGDATEAELQIREVNAGVYAFDGAALLDALAQLAPHNAQGEYYLPDTFTPMRQAGRTIAAHQLPDPDALLGVNDRAELAHVSAVAQRRIHRRHQQAGVTIVDPDSTLIEVDVVLGPDTTVEPSSFLRGATHAGAGCRIGPLTTLIDVTLGDECSIVQSYLDSCEVRTGAKVGPFTYVRPGTLIREGAKAGTFVEIKNSDIGAGAKVPHLSYIGDADIGEEANLGAGTITANYDGRAKHRTTIGRRVRGGVDTSLVAPVTVADDAYTAAGSVITEDVPPGALGIARARQTNIEGYAERVDAAARETAERPGAAADDARRESHSPS
ncbi:MAG TPA: bifunctional UDP-N-acetylglucosamine diphosphorylase/glucosamine-1-phosphate N-acetyltransferase GlmU [Solirubrobacteraceae bacterium]|nr:bifunctional UDP-N-acetylglucosamine diphosphorylase/glucosamine-1-phosphate N-acetyltransferase GlmU [Solirubrobacteraceae bacterium]